MTDFAHRSAISADGTRIAYRQYGEGAGVVVVPGGMQAAHNLGRLAGELADAGFAVQLVERRGRGRSGPFGPGFDAEKARQDLAAVVRDSGSRRVFGLSAGATIALHTALIEPAIEKLAVYEPPLSLFRPMAGPWFPRYEREVDEGRLAAAMVTLIKSDLGIETSLKILPRFVLEKLFSIAIAEEAEKARKAGDDRVPLGELIPTFRFDVRVIEEISTRAADLARLQTDVLLMSGTRSASYLHDIAHRLEHVLPRVRRVDLRGVGHIAPDDGGRPALVARELTAFFR